MIKHGCYLGFRCLNDLRMTSSAASLRQFTRARDEENGEEGETTTTIGEHSGREACWWTIDFAWLFRARRILRVRCPLEYSNVNNIGHCVLKHRCYAVMGGQCQQYSMKWCNEKWWDDQLILPINLLLLFYLLSLFCLRATMVKIAVSWSENNIVDRTH